jgi:endonuclease/exonuclease/phosphatase family metal-dependent hydrolase
MSDSSEHDSKISRRRFLIGAGIAAGAASLDLVMHHSFLRHGHESCVIGNNAEVFDDPNPVLMTYNIANARGGDKDFLDPVPPAEQMRNLDNIISVIIESGASIIGLNEIDFNSSRTCGLDQSVYIAVALARIWGVAYIAKGANVRTARVMGLPYFTFGNALVSRYPIEKSSNNAFGNHVTRIAHQFKGYLDATLKIGSTKLDVVVTHLYDGDVNMRLTETRELKDSLSRRSDRYVLMGDLNSLPGHHDSDGGRVIERLAGVAIPVETSILTYSTNRPEHKLDYILTSKHLPSYDSRAISSDASDHLALCCGIDLKGAKV